MVQLSHPLAFVHQQRKREFVLLTKAAVAGRALWIDPQHLRINGLDGFPVVPQLAELFGSTRRIVTRVENQDYPPPA